MSSNVNEAALGQGGRSCSSCGSGLNEDQRYCVQCGAVADSALPSVRTALASGAQRRAGPPSGTRALMLARLRAVPWLGGSRLHRAGWATGLASASIGLGIVFGALVSPVAETVAAPLIELGIVPAHQAAPPTEAAQAGPPAPADASPSSPGAPGPAAPRTGVPAVAAAAGTAVAAPAAVTPSGSSTPAGGGSSGPSGGGGSGGSTPTHTPPKLPAIRHVWLVVLADQAFHSLYGPESPAHFLNQTLVPRGTLLRRYYATAHGSLADGVALISGQGPTPELQLGCPVFANVAPGSTDNSGIAHGRGCLFPWNPQTFVGVQTLPDLLTGYHFTWKAYVGGQGAVTPPAAPPTGTTTTGSGLTLPGGITLPIGTPTTASSATSAPPPSATPATCRHPQLGAADPTASAETSADGYLTRRNPFVYFHSLIDSASCAQLDLGLDSLASDLTSGHVPSFSWIAPDLCSGGAADGCPAATPLTGAAAADAFLSQWIPKIMATSAYRKDGMIVILSDQAPGSGPAADSSACCQKLRYPNSANPGGPAKPGPGGGLTGALVLSRFAAKGGSDTTPSDHYTLLRTIEDIFKITPPLGYALRRQDFTASVFPKESGGSSAVTTSVHHPRRLAILTRKRSAPPR